MTRTPPVADATAATSVHSVVVTDPIESARAAGLHHVHEEVPGIRRRRAGKGFSYLGPDGQPVRDAATVRRIRSLAIPPAWRSVWICADPDGHIQAVGRDARGRKQYRYHTRWREVRDETKYNRMLQFAQALPRIRARIDHDLSLPGVQRRKVLATVVRLLETTLIRVGNPEYSRNNDSYGLTTMRDGHVDVTGSRMRFHFRGKSGKEHVVDVHDRRLARIVRSCQDLPGQALFQYVDEVGRLQHIDSSDVNAWLREVTGADFTAKDFRTWAGTALATGALLAVGPAPHATGAKKLLVQAVRNVAQKLGNTPAVCRRCYVHPAVFEAWRDGSLFALADPPGVARGIAVEDRAALEVLVADLLHRAATRHGPTLEQALQASIAEQGRETRRKAASGAATRHPPTLEQVLQASIAEQGAEPNRKTASRAATGHPPEPEQPLQPSVAEQGAESNRKTASRSAGARLGVARP